MDRAVDGHHRRTSGSGICEQIWDMVSARRPEGHVEMLDVFTGTVDRIADNYDDFVAEVNQRWWQEVYLLSELALRLHEANKIPAIPANVTLWLLTLHTAVPIH